MKKFKLFNLCSITLYRWMKDETPAELKICSEKSPRHKRRHTYEVACHSCEKEITLEEYLSFAKDKSRKEILYAILKRV